MTIATSKPLVVLGFDGAEPDLLQQWANEGRLPTLRKIMERGCWAETGGQELQLEHGVWQIILSGRSRAQSGYHYFRELSPRSYNLKLMNGGTKNAHPFWADQHNARVLIADVPDVLPIAGIKGTQLANWAIHRGWKSRDPAEQPMSEPRELLRQIEKLVGPAENIIENVRSTPEEDFQIYRRLLDRLRRKGAVCRSLIGQDHPDVVVIVFGESHTAGHQFWKYLRKPEIDTASRPELKNAIRSVYEAIDREMGLLLKEMPADSNVFILSSIGLTDHYPTGQLLECFCRSLGYQISPNGAPKSFHPLSIARRLVPNSWRVALSRHFSRETRERLLADHFRSATDWSKTTAFAVPSLYTGFIRVNLRGREPAGIVEPGKEYEDLLNRLEADLSQLVDPITNAPAIKSVIKTAEVFGEDAIVAIPDLIVHWQPATHFLERVIHPRCELSQKRSEFNRDSDHREHGFFAAAGPGIIKRGRLPEMNVLDLAPTFLHLLGQPKDPQMSGRVARNLF